MLETARGYFEQRREIALEWITNPAAYAQFGLLIAAFLMAVILNKKLAPIVRNLADPGEDQTVFAPVRRFALSFLPVLLPLIAYGLTAAGEEVTRSLFGSGAVIAFGKRVFVFLAVRALVQKVFTDAFLKALGKYIFIPMAAAYALGLLIPIQVWLGETVIGVGDIRFSVLAVLRALIVGGVLFWLGRWSSERGTGYIRAQEELRPSIRELSAKSFEIAVFGVVFLLLVNILGLDLSALAILGGAIGVGLGFGLQKIASNFISGVILLLEGQATVGDYVELDGGEAGTIAKLGARATMLKTFDGKQIVVPNEDFITSRIINWSDGGSANRYEAEFSVSYETDINLIPDIVEKAVAKHPGVLSEPEEPDCELRGFGDSGVNFSVEFWVEGLDDGKNKFSSDVLFLIWNALKENQIEIPFPQRELRLRDSDSLLSIKKADG